MISNQNIFTDHTDYIEPSSLWNDDYFIHEDEFPFMSELQMIAAEEVIDTLVMQSMGVRLI